MRLITTLVILGLSVGPTVADEINEYKKDNYESYGYGAAASVIQGTRLKAGLRGSHVAYSDHEGNNYYPGFTATNPCSKINSK